MQRRELLRSSAFAGAGLMLSHKTALPLPRMAVRLNRLPATARHLLSRERTWDAATRR